MATNPAETRTHSFMRVVVSWRQWWRKSVIGTVDQAEVIARRRQECTLSARYLFMLSMSAGIAILGLLLSSPAVVIGAMLLSPLMDPIMGVGFALAIGDFHWLKQAGRSLLVGTVMAILFCAFVVLLSPLQTVTGEIAARTRPNLFDLGVALFSALAGAYAMIRGREGTVVGVAIATALMPPLAVVGFGLATLNWTVFTGALLLFVTNLVTIALTAALMARAYGFRTSLTERQTQLQAGAILVVFVALAIPLGISLRQIAWEAQATRTIRGELLDEFAGNARLSQLDINFDAEPVTIVATVLTPDIRSDAENVASRAIERQLDQPVEVTITQYQVGTGSKAAEEAQLAAVRAREAADRQRAEELASNLALVAGVDEKQVLLDRERRHALVTAEPLPGAGLAAYRALESRIAATEPEWTVEVRPPARPLPRIAFMDGEPAPSAGDNLALIAWAAKRVGAPVVLSGAENEVQQVAALLKEQGVTARTETRPNNGGTVIVRWGAPGE